MKVFKAYFYSTGRNRIPGRDLRVRKAVVAQDILKEDPEATGAPEATCASHLKQSHSRGHSALWMQLGPSCRASAKRTGCFLRASRESRCSNCRRVVAVWILFFWVQRFFFFPLFLNPKSSPVQGIRAVPRYLLETTGPAPGCAASHGQI